MRKIYARGNKLINTFKHCSDRVKVTLFKTSTVPIYGVVSLRVYSKYSKLPIIIYSGNYSLLIVCSPL